ncbi:MAG: fructosamine kinase family protein [Betaproteobacteria bacterium]|nr:fructosamine kinase family protein [Betaproteobacteria bacterium]
MQGLLLAAIGGRIGEVLGRRVDLRNAQEVGGGCIHSAFRVTDGGQSWFVKVNGASRADLFAAEADGLHALAQTPVRVPRVISRGETGEQSFLVLEWLNLSAGAPRDYAKLGEQLARLHALAGPHHGWRRDNYIGSTPQRNAADASWPRFFGSARLAPQLALAGRNGHAALCAKGEELFEALPRLFGAHAPRPSLLHGDLWGGNAAFLADGTPVIFDPATYYGDREADLAMTELFGGFPEDFYAAYRAHAPLDSGYRVRKMLYKLYHVLNHANLFGGGYVAQAEKMMDRLSTEA